MSLPSNALNISAPGIVVFDGVATFNATTTTQYNTLVGNTGNTIANVAPGSAGQVLTSNGASANPSYQTPTFTPMAWTDEAANFAVVAGNGYFITASAIGTLPASPSQGNMVSFAVDNGTAILTIQANTGQLIKIGKNTSAAAGTAVSNFNGDSITLVYRAADTTWVCVGGPEGTWTLT